MSDLECITSYADICIMKNQITSSVVSNGVATTPSVSVSSDNTPKKVRVISLCKFVKRMDVCPMTPKGFNKRAQLMAKGIAFMLIRKYPFLGIGQRFTAKTAEDFAQEAYLRLITPTKKKGILRFSHADFTYNGEPLTQGRFWRLWLKASIQCVQNGAKKGGNSKTKAIISLFVADDDNNEMVNPQVERAMALASKSKVEIDLQKEVRHLFNLADNNADRRFWQTFERMIEVEVSPLPTADACVLQGWLNRNAYYVQKKRMLADDRLQALCNVKALREIF